MAGNHPEEPVPRPVVHQAWRRTTFIHWPVDELEVARFLPAGLEPDPVEGRAWVSLTPFEVRGFRPSFAPALPGVSAFPETNLRTYVRHRESGRDGLWFLSLDVASLVSTIGGRTLRVPYHLARMEVRVDGARVHYRSRRVGGDAHHRITVEVGEAIPPEQVSPRDAQLAGRWRAFVASPLGLRVVAVRHQPWPLVSASLVELDETITAAAGVRGLGEPVVQYSPGVDAWLSAPRRA